MNLTKEEKNVKLQMIKQSKRLGAVVIAAMIGLQAVCPVTIDAETVSGNEIKQIELENTDSAIEPMIDEQMTVSDNTCEEDISAEQAGNTVNKPAKMTLTEVTPVDYQSIKLSFATVAEADGYEIYRAEGANGKFTVLASVPASFTSYVDANKNGTYVKTGMIYQYQIRAYKKNGSQIVYGDFSEKKSAMTTLAAPTLLEVNSISYDTIQVSYSEVAGAQGYLVYVSGAVDQEFMLASRVEGGNQLSFAYKGCVLGQTYYFKVCAYRVENGKDVVSDFSEVLSAATTFAKPVVVAISQVNYKTLKVSYQKILGASGYQIYRSTKKNSGYKKIGTVKKGGKIAYSDTKCNAGLKYYYKVRAYRKTGGKTVYSDFSAPKSAKIVLPATTITQAAAVGADTLGISWKKVKGASGYAILRSDKKKGIYEVIATVDGVSTLTADVPGQENGGEYYFKVKAFTKNGKKISYGLESKPKKVSFKYYTYAGESYQEKAMRVFGTIYYNKYPSSAVAQQHMTTITINAWDIATGGAKVTKQRSLTVNAAIAPSVEKIFEEIYEGEEQFPIKSIGGFSWRGNYSEHCDGLAIDINPNENYMVEGNGKISSGSFWLPGQNAYSIPADGEVVKIFKKYGFGWGGDGWSSGRHDYMHFSYFGN